MGLRLQQQSKQNKLINPFRSAPIFYRLFCRSLQLALFKRSTTGVSIVAITFLAIISQFLIAHPQPAFAQTTTQRSVKRSVKRSIKSSVKPVKPLTKQLVKQTTPKYTCDATAGSVRCVSDDVRISPNGSPIRAEPGWSLWFDNSRRAEADFDAGFSNLELGGYMEFEAACQRDTGLKPTEVEYWFRLNNSLLEIGTGQVEFGCWRNHRFVHRFTSTAVRRGLDNVTCLLVDSPIGNGLVVRSQPGFNSQRLGVVANYTEVEPVSFPALIISENNRNWLKIAAPIEGWISNGSPISKGNLRLCG
jgi:hypothetical protein